MIKTKYILKYLILLFITTACLFLSINCKSKDLGSYKYPNANVILILIDTLRADHLGCYGYHRNTSPEIDKLAMEGITFKNMLAQTSWTRPGTASILTGLYPKNHGANTRDDSLAEEATLLSEILGQVGYTSYAFVANGNAGEDVGFDQGYKEFYSSRNGLERDKRLKQAKSNEVSRRVSEVIRQLEKPGGNFIYIHYIDPHAPYLPKEKHFSKGDKTVFTIDFVRSREIFKMSEEERNRVLKEMINAYDDEILFNDKMIGRVVQALKEKNMYDNSIIIITSDHGEEFLDHNGTGHGRTLYDEQLRVPLIIRLPDNIHREIHRIANQVDICPTVLSLLKIPIPKIIDGIDLFDETIPPREYNYAEINLDYHVAFSVQSPQNKFIERINTLLKSQRKFRWFAKTAVLKTGEDSLELIIGSFHRKGFVQVLSDGKLVKRLVIKPGKLVFDIVLPKSNKEKTVTIRSQFPCRSPADLGKSMNTRCMSFRIFDSKNIDIRNILSECCEEYYLLADDPEEKKNFAYRRRFKKIIMELKKKLQKYKTDKRNLRLNKKPVVFDKEQLEELKALGYI